MLFKEGRLKGMSKSRGRILIVIALLVALGVGLGLTSWQATAPQSQALNGASTAQRDVASAPDGSEIERYEAEPGLRHRDNANEMLSAEQYWTSRVTYPTGRFSGAWLLDAARQDKQVQKAVPAGRVIYSRES